MTSQINELLANNKLKAIIFDLDDTLIETYDVFVKCLNELFQELSIVLNIPVEELKIIYEEIEKEGRKKFHVDPIPLWNYIFEELSSKYPAAITHEVKRNSLAKIYKEIYCGVIPLKPFTIELLNLIKAQGIPMHILTNAEQQWTNHKIETSGLSEYFSDENLKIVPPHMKKTSSSWAGVVSELNINPGEVIIIGDNVSADCIAGLEAGAHVIHLYESHLNKSYRAAGIEELISRGVMQVTSIRELYLRLKIYFESEIKLR